MSGFGNPEDMGVAVYLAMPIVEVGDGTEPLPHTRGTFTPTANLTDGDGRLGTGLLATLADSIGGLTSGLACLPDWIVTTNLTMRRAADALEDDRGTGPLTLDVRVLRRGRSAVVTRIDVVDDSNHAVATSWMTCAILTPANGPPAFVRPLRADRERSTDPAFDITPSEFFSLTSTETPGTVSLRVSDLLRNPWGILHGGSVAVIADAAARSLVAGEATAIHYLSPGRVGPVVATATSAGRRHDEHLVRVEIRDHGADDRLMSLAMATVRAVD
jgi:acyl-coenzyme A thioesterase PaaI-like protein